MKVNCFDKSNQVSNKTADGTPEDCSNPSQISDSDLPEENFVPGNVVWAKMRGSTWWPAMVEDDPDESMYYWEDETTNEMVYNVTFFGKKVSRAHVAAKYVENFRDDPSYFAHNKKKKSAHLITAIEQAQHAASLSIADRLEKYSFVVLYKGKWPKVSTKDYDLSDLLPPPLPTENASNVNGTSKTTHSPLSAKGPESVDSINIGPKNEKNKSTRSVEQKVKRTEKSKVVPQSSIPQDALVSAMNTDSRKRKRKSDDPPNCKVQKTTDRLKVQDEAIISDEGESQTVMPESENAIEDIVETEKTVTSNNLPTPPPDELDCELEDPDFNTFTNGINDDSEAESVSESGDNNVEIRDIHDLLWSPSRDTFRRQLSDDESYELSDLDTSTEEPSTSELKAQTSSKKEAGLGFVDVELADTYIIKRRNELLKSCNFIEYSESVDENDYLEATDD